MIDVDEVEIDISSIYDSWNPWTVGNRSLIYTRKNIGDTGLPCGIPAFISLNSSICPSKASLRDLLERKDFAQVIRLIGRPSLFRVSRNWL